MQQLYYIKKNKLEWRDMPDPVLMSPKEAIVRPIVAGRCDGDMVFLKHNFTLPIKIGVALHYLDPIVTSALGGNPFKGPIAVGHECIAEIISIGTEVTQFQLGQKVIVPWAISCGQCNHCQRGLTSHCSAHSETVLSAYGFGPAAGNWGGMITDLLRVPYADAMLIPVPDGIDPIHLASASDNIPDGWRTVAPHLKKYPEANVLVVRGGVQKVLGYTLQELPWALVRAKWIILTIANHG